MTDETLDIHAEAPPVAAEQQPPAETSVASEPAEPRRADDDVRDAIALLKEGGQPGEVRQRDPKTGQFVKTAESDAAPGAGGDQGKPAAAKPPAQEQAKPADKITDQDGKPTTDAAPSSPPAGPPAGWSADAKAQWSTLPPAIQAAVSRREQEVSDGFRQKSEELKQWQGIEQQLAPRRQSFKQMGYQDDGQVIQHLLTFADAYAQNPTALIRHLATSAGLDLRQLAGQPAVQPRGQQRPTATAQPRSSNGQIDPAVYNELNSLKQSLAERDRRDVQGQLERFAADPNHPHFEEVRRDMAAFIRAGEPDLQKAYERAIWSNPQVREKVLAEQAKTKADADAQAKAAKAAAARSAAVSPRGAGPGGAKPTPNGSFDPAKSDVYGAVRAAIATHAGQV